MFCLGQFGEKPWQIQGILEIVLAILEIVLGILEIVLGILEIVLANPQNQKIKRPKQVLMYMYYIMSYTQDTC